MVTKPMIIRPAEIRDAEALYDFVIRLDRNDRPASEPPRTPVMTADDIRKAGFGSDPQFEAFIAEDDGNNTLGAISFARGYSGWYAGPTASVHMLYVSKDARGQGVGRALISAVAALTVERNWHRVDLLVEDINPAVGFYEALGLRNAGELRYFLDGRALSALAGAPQ